jgi:hypothetical protein
MLDLSSWSLSKEVEELFDCENSIRELIDNEYYPSILNLLSILKLPTSIMSGIDSDSLIILIDLFNAYLSIFLIRELIFECLSRYFLIKATSYI